MNRNILNQAFITMGYRQMSSYNIGNVYGKPIGFGIIIAKINQNHKEITFKSIFRNYTTGEATAWLTSRMNIDYTNPKTGYETFNGENLYNQYINDIASTETEHGDIIHKFMSNGTEYKNSTFAFSTRNDIMSMINI